jgi:hypothetical protein
MSVIKKRPNPAPPILCWDICVGAYNAELHNKSHKKTTGKNKNTKATK